MKGATLMVMKTVINEFYLFSALVEHGNKPDMEQLFLKVAAKYKECMHDMNGRSPGPTTMFAVHNLKPNVPKGYQINFNPRYLLGPIHTKRLWLLFRFHLGSVLFTPSDSRYR